MFPSNREPGFTSAADADLEEDKLDENANPLAINGSGDQPSSSEFRHGHPIAVRITTPILDCLACGNPGRLRCARCKSWYCSQRCQANHWPIHRKDCIPPPPLENPDGTEYVAPSRRLLRQPTVESNDGLDSAEPEAPNLPKYLRTPINTKSDQDLQKASKATVQSNEGMASAETASITPKTKPAQDMPKAAAPHLSPTKEKLNQDLQKAIEKAEKVLSAPSSPAKTVETKAKQESSKLMLKDFNRTQIVKGDVVIKLGYGEWCDMMIVVKKDDYPEVKQVDDILRDAALAAMGNLPPVCGGELGLPEPGQMVAVKTNAIKAEGAYHRAVIRAVNQAQGKAKLRLLEHGVTVIEPFASLAEIPDEALDGDKYPPFACMLAVSGIEGAVKMDVEKNQVMMRTLDPVLEAGLTVSEVLREAEGKVTYKLTHPNGSLVSKIISEKIAEPEEKKSKGEVQGMDASGFFAYDKCNFAELEVDAVNLQEVFVLHVDGPQEIYVTPCDQLEVCDTIMEQVQKYAAATEESLRGHRPRLNQMCLGKASEDGQWYRAACVDDSQAQLGSAADKDVFTLFFADFGFIEDVSPTNIVPVDASLMKTPLLANHCVLKGFENLEGSPDTQTVEAVKAVIVANDLAEIKVLEKTPGGGPAIIQVPALKLPSQSVVSSVPESKSPSTNEEPKNEQKPAQEQSAPEQPKSSQAAAAPSSATSAPKPLTDKPD